MPTLSSAASSVNECTAVPPALEIAHHTNVVRKGQESVNRVARRVIQEKKRKIEQDEFSGKEYDGKDLLSLFRMYSTLSSIS